MADQHPGGISPLQQMVASGAGAVVTSLFMTPLDVVKVRLQSQRPSVASGECPTLEPGEGGPGAKHSLTGTRFPGQVPSSPDLRACLVF